MNIIKFNDGKIGLKWRLKYNRKVIVEVAENVSIVSKIVGKLVVLVPLNETPHGKAFRNYIRNEMDCNKVILKLHPRETNPQDFSDFEKMTVTHVENVHFEDCVIVNLNSSAKIYGDGNSCYCITEIEGVCILPDAIANSGLVFGQKISTQNIKHFWS